MLKRVLFQVSYQIENNLNQFFNSFFSKQMLIPAYSNIPFNNQLNNNENQNIPSFSELFGDILLMAAPKSRVSHARKTRKHLRYIPKPKQWMTCTRCGEPKLPHRICKENANVCAMREEDWQAYKAKKLAEKAAPEN